ncbi:OmpA family protein [Pseudomonas petrae]|uniref:OmpA family protein n=1 Tax=Pseudomonas petrae TaxID=2912190 RepID=A0ABS9IBY9_9PSED|nr:OmpA family protein [Pseudomonas petrae]MCF7535566.1 OmpA family protein [Pseudomonas petrae]MCF7540587.1 OmpA family protein [Pseudomonas petrae]MCF7545235.1 OmpA family protein [Pseudomonas petrae]MCF7558986.1 OmpA family protein [Pseudomonas petrae]
MSMIRTALPLILVTSVLTGCAGLQKTDWPLCAAGGALTGAAIGAFQTASVAAGFGGAVGVMAGAYCWAHGDGDDDGDGVLNSKDKCPDTPKGTPVDATGCPIVTPAPEPMAAPVVLPKEEIITIRDVHFEFNKATLTPGDKQQLDMVATKLKTEAPNVQLHVSGHTDSVGSDAYNQKLSQKRAQSVTDYLVSAGIPRASFASVEGDGEARPVADNKTADGRALNRRVEIKINR